MQKSKEEEISKQEENIVGPLPEDHPLLKAKTTLDILIDKT